MSLKSVEHVKGWLCVVGSLGLLCFRSLYGVPHYDLKIHVLRRRMTRAEGRTKAEGGIHGDGRAPSMVSTTRTPSLVIRGSTPSQTLWGTRTRATPTQTVQGGYMGACTPPQTLRGTHMGSTPPQTLRGAHTGATLPQTLRGAHMGHPSLPPRRCGPATMHAVLHATNRRRNLALPPYTASGVGRPRPLHT